MLCSKLHNTWYFECAKTILCGDYISRYFWKCNLGQHYPFVLSAPRNKCSALECYAKKKKGLLAQLPNLDLVLTKTRPDQMSLDKSYTPEWSYNPYNSVMRLSNRQQVTLTITREHVLPLARGKRKILFDDPNRQPCPTEGDRSVGGDRWHPRRQINCPRTPDCDPLPVAHPDRGSLCFSVASATCWEIEMSKRQRKPVCLIAAVCKGMGIGKDGKMPWDIP